LFLDQVELVQRDALTFKKGPTPFFNALPDQITQRPVCVLIRRQNAAGVHG